MNMEKSVASNLTKRVRRAEWWYQFYRKGSAALAIIYLIVMIYSIATKVLFGNEVNVFLCVALCLTLALFFGLSIRLLRIVSDRLIGLMELDADMLLCPKCGAVGYDYYCEKCGGYVICGNARSCECMDSEN